MTAKIPKPLSMGEETLAMHLTALHIPFAREAQFAPQRKFRFDFLIEGSGLAIEVDGGTWSNGGHSRGKGFAKDCEKLNLAVELGFRVLRYTTDSVLSGEAIEQIERILYRYR